MADMLLGALDVIVSGCDSINTNEIEYIYYSNQNSTKPIQLNSSNLKQVSSKLPTKMILHGWFGSATGPSEIAVKDAYLKRGDYNVIFVNWEKHAMVNYAQAHCSLKIIGNTGIPWGAHLAGHVGQRIRQRTGGQKLFRITGLDAAGPGFLGFPEDDRLDASDAYFVDAIHTNGAQFGYPRNYGSVDFYPNCGLFQPGCLDYDITDRTTLLQQTMENHLEQPNSNKFREVETTKPRPKIPLNPRGTDSHKRKARAIHCR
ncbi:hypothetical protein ILUMI_22467 [Ignelater luminosus]|uniref:Lipase domain-containing protein n=1 Tax=Ignelater luminosus TaxID=2038154 RepID=A0A8K0CGP6_IGNLU|nr:hypothetical protein ILUMI_22467 [Ignelater luminosus]